jgi:hypothetical protein
MREKRSLSLLQYFCNEKPENTTATPAITGENTFEKNVINSG